MDILKLLPSVFLNSRRDQGHAWALPLLSGQILSSRPIWTIYSIFETLNITSSQADLEAIANSAYDLTLSDFLLGIDGLIVS